MISDIDMFTSLMELGIVTMAIELLLSPHNIVGNFCGKPNSEYNDLNQHNSRPASDNATYSASVDDKARVVCFFDLHVIAPPEAKNT